MFHNRFLFSKKQNIQEWHNFKKKGKHDTDKILL